MRAFRFASRMQAVSARALCDALRRVAPPFSIASRKAMPDQ